MNRKEWLQRLIISYFIVVTCVNLVMAVLGLCYDSEIRFGYEAFFVPLIYGVIGIIPVLVTYSRKELTLRQLLVRKVLQLILLEVLLTGIVFQNPRMSETPVLPFIIAVFLVNLVVQLILWGLDHLKAKELNHELTAFQMANRS